MKIMLSTVGTLGDVIPFARLGDALRARGHAVTVHSWQQFAAWFPPGAAFEPVAEGVTADELATTLAEALPAPSFVVQKLRFVRMFYGLGDGPARARAAYDHARARFAGHDLAIINVLDQIAQLAAADLGVPWVSYASRPPPEVAQADALNSGIDDAVSELFAQVTGKPRRIRTFREYSPLLGLAACAPELVPAALPLLVEPTGAWLGPVAPAPLGADLEAFVAGGPCLFATFGTMPDVFGRTAALIEGAAASGWRAIVQVLVPATTPPSSEALFVLRDRVAFDALVPRVAAVVHHGSVGTLHEVVRAGKPSLVIPHMGDQFFWAHALHGRGLGPPPIAHAAITPAAVAERMAALREPAYAAQAEALAPAIAGRDGVAYAVRRIEEVTA